MKHNQHFELLKQAATLDIASPDTHKCHVETIVQAFRITVKPPFWNLPQV